MMEWVLILVLNQNVAPQVITGFESETTCLLAGVKLQRDLGFGYTCILRKFGNDPR